MSEKKEISKESILALGEELDIADKRKIAELYGGPTPFKYYRRLLYLFSAGVYDERMIPEVRGYIKEKRAMMERLAKKKKAEV